MKKLFISRYSLLLLCSSFISLFTLPELSAQLTFYAETDMQQELYTHPEGDLLAISNTKVAEIANSLSIASGYQVTFFAEPNYAGPSLVLSTGEYDELPHYYSTLAAEGGEEGIRALTIGSYKLERSSSDNHVDLWFASEARNGQVSNSSFDQRVEAGVYTAANLIGTPALDEDEGELWPKLWMNAISVPRGFVVKLSNAAGKSMTLANDDKNSHAKTFSTDQFPGFHQNIAKIEVMEARYRIKSVQLESVTVNKGAVQESFHTIMNNEDTEKQSDIMESFQAQASLSHIYHDSPLSVSAPSGKVQLSVKGEALGADDGNEETNRLFEEATVKSITAAISAGHSVPESIDYNIQEACSFVCPPNSLCETKMTLQPENVAYNVFTTLERINENGQPVANSDFTLTSKLQVRELKVGECITEEPQPLIGGLPADVTTDIGGLRWLTRNLNTSNCEEGFPIDSSNYQASENGILYNAMALEQCNICPSGWRLPTKADFKSLGNTGLTAEEVAQQLNISEESMGSSEYLMIDGARIYSEDFDDVLKGSGFTKQGGPGDFHPVRCVFGDTPMAMVPEGLDSTNFEPALLSINYETEQVGARTWLKNDLTITELPCLTNAQSEAEWKTAGENNTPAFSWYGGNPESAEKGIGNGVLYNWYAVSCDICPSGFRIPTETELKELIAAKAKERVNIGDGIRKPEGAFTGRGSSQKTYWSSTETPDGGAKNGCSFTSQGISWSDPQNKGFGFYVRCIKEE